jgi:hypothetical protein
MRRDAERQARERSTREGVACFVYFHPNGPPCVGDPGPTWYVRTHAEGEPEGAELVYITRQEPEGGWATWIPGKAQIAEAKAGQS